MATAVVPSSAISWVEAGLCVIHFQQLTDTHVLPTGNIKTTLAYESFKLRGYDVDVVIFEDHGLVNELEFARDIGYTAPRYGHVMFVENVHEPALELTKLLPEVLEEVMRRPRLGMRRSSGPRKSWRCDV